MKSVLQLVAAVLTDFYLFIYLFIYLKSEPQIIFLKQCLIKKKQKSSFFCTENILNCSFKTKVRKKICVSLSPYFPLWSEL